MAGASAKKQVQNNLKLLKFVEILVGASYLIFFSSIFYFKRPQSAKPSIIFAIPVFISVLIIEKTGRPKYDSTGKVISSGQDLSQAGLVEYLFDIIYFTIFVNLLSVLFGSNRVWLLYLIIPIFAGYKAYGLFNAGKQLLGFGGNKKNKDAKEELDSNSQTKSKRQQKLEARGDKAKIRYR